MLVVELRLQCRFGSDAPQRFAQRGRVLEGRVEQERVRVHDVSQRAEEEREIEQVEGALAGQQEPHHVVDKPVVVCKGVKGAGQGGQVG